MGRQRASVTHALVSAQPEVGICCHLLVGVHMTSAVAEFWLWFWLFILGMGGCLLCWLSVKSIKFVLTARGLGLSRYSCRDGAAAPAVPFRVRLPAETICHQDYMDPEVGFFFHCEKTTFAGMLLPPSTPFRP